MATRPIEDKTWALIKAYTVASAQTVTRGRAVVFASADNEILDDGTESQLAIGIALESGIAGEEVTVALFGVAIVAVIVGTGDATRGVLAVEVATGFTDVTLADGAAIRAPAGRFMQSGVASDEVGLLLNNFVTSAT